jgi:hypothetical protein
MKRLRLAMIAALAYFYSLRRLVQWTSPRGSPGLWVNLLSFIARDLTGTPCVLEDYTPGNAEIFQEESTDLGAVWTSNQRLTWNSGASGWPVMTLDVGNYIHVLWEDDTPGKSEIFHKKSTNLGDTWLGVKNLSSTPGDSWNVTVALDASGTLHVLWNDKTPGNYEIYYTRSTDRGDTWAVSQRLTWTAADSWSPEIVMDFSNNIHVVWFEFTAGNAEIFYKRSTDQGITWAATQRLCWTSGFSLEPAITADSSGNIHVIWSDNSPGNNEIYYKKSPDKGVTWAPLRKLTWTAGESAYPRIVFDAWDNIHLVWMDNTPGNAEIYYKVSTDGGVSWSAAQRLTSTSGNSFNPFLAVDTYGNLHVVWHDDTPGNFQIYYKKHFK